MAKIHDIANTSQMSIEYDGSAIDVQHRAKKDLDNGRIVKIGADNLVDYADKGETGEVYLLHSVEQMADTTKGLTEFYNFKDDPVRIMRFRNGDKFTTTAIATDTYAENDELVVDANGILKKGTATTEKIKFFVVKPDATLGFTSYSYGFDSFPALEVRVER